MSMWGGTVDPEPATRKGGHMAAETTSGANTTPRDHGERADAARNRTKILAAAETLVSSHGADWSMGDVAATAGVGVGTIYRRFTSQAGLIEALMDDREAHLQHAMIEGPPPLGPGASPAERIRAFLHAYVDLLGTYGPLMAAAEATMSPERHYRTGPYAMHQQHLAGLIGQLDSTVDTEYLADALLAPLVAGLFTLQHHDEGRSTDRIKHSLDILLAGVSSLGQNGT